MRSSKRDEKYMRLALDEAITAGKEGNFPIGAALVIDNVVAGTARNALYTNKNWDSHAENALLRQYSPIIADEHRKGATIELFSTLEPCMMCFGTALLHRVSRIIYGCPDPYGGATHIQKESLPEFYQNNWPEIVSGPYAQESYDLLINTFKGNPIHKEALEAFERRGPFR